MHSATVLGIVVQCISCKFRASFPSKSTHSRGYGLNSQFKSTGGYGIPSPEFADTVYSI